MKIMSRDFTRAEKIMMLLLVLILLGLAYYKFVDQTVRSSIRASEAEKESLQMELTAAEERLEQLQTVQSALDELQADGTMSWMASYNNSEAEVAFLNDILAKTRQYSISFANVSRSGDQIRRSFSLQYLTSNYKAAQKIMDQLCSGVDRCIVGDVNCNIDERGRTTVSASATFYETMVGGTPDAELPADSADTNS